MKLLTTYIQNRVRLDSGLELHRRITTNDGVFMIPALSYRKIKKLEKDGKEILLDLDVADSGDEPRKAKVLGINQGDGPLDFTK